MKVIISGISVLACSTLAAANHHPGSAHTVTKRQFELPFGAGFAGAGYIGAAGVPLVFRRRDGSQPTNTSSVVYTVNLQLPSVGGPFGRSTISAKDDVKYILTQYAAYHVHVNPLDAFGTCASAGPHLDPANRTETPLCDPTAPQTCQAGDISGKYGKLNGTCAFFSVTDPYTTLTPGLSNSIVGRSMVIHSANGTRIACANLTSLDVSAYSDCASGNMSSTSSPTGGMSWNPDATILPSIYAGGASAGPGARLIGALVILAGAVLGGWAL